MKVGFVGAGLVGSTAAYTTLLRGIGREIVLVDKDTARAASEADDIGHAVPFAEPVNITSGDYESLAGASAVVVAAGVSQKPGETRMSLLGRNACVFAEVVPSILSAAPDAVLIIATNPVDVMTHVADRFARDFGSPAGRVFGTGTTLDTARFRTLIATRMGIDARHVHAYVLGEHGDSEVLAWSAATIAGMPLEEFCSTRNVSLGEAERTEIDDAVRNAAYRIIAGKRSTYYGVASAIAHIVDTVLSDRRSVLPVCAPSDVVAGVEDVTVALPRLVGGQGVLDTYEPNLSPEEMRALGRSATAVREAIDEVYQSSCV